ncbi:MFS transporter [Paenibacillus tuaregi]|uniref:MFS transporter n=1 Tax=Paenibacillus tuaregi TaxID=1816681 RepID=UPI000838D297|nr:MFS transporter [Paenibacillus tuaregi]
MSIAASLIEDSKTSSKIRKIVGFASGGIFIDGYILIMIGIALVTAAPALSMNETWIGLEAIASLVGMFFGGLIGGYLSDFVGRKKMYIIDLLIMLVSSLAIFIVQSPFEFFITRLIMGVAIGADYPISMALVTEFTPKKHRGVLNGAVITIWNVGAIVASAIGFYMLSWGPDSWRWMLGSSAVFCIILLIGRWDTPESPRWLASKGRVDEALLIAKKIWGDNVTIEDLQEDQKNKTSFAKLFKKEYLGRLVFVITLWSIINIPQYAMYSFGPQILQALGLAEGNQWIWGYAALTLFLLLGCFPALRLVETVGRRPLAVWGYLLLTIPLLVLGFLPEGTGMIAVICFAVYALFNGGPNILTAVYPLELFPTEIRGSAFGFATAITRLSSAVGTYLVPVALLKIGVNQTMIWAAVLCFIGFLVALVWAPETKRKTLQETSSPGKTLRSI